ACTTGSIFLGAGTTCSPNPCVANDSCANAITVTSGVAVAGTNTNASSIGDGPVATCQSSAGKGIWYRYTPAATGSFMASTCGSPQDTVLQILTTPDCTAFTTVACDDDSCAGGEAGLCTGTASGNASLISSVTLTGGT